jgi:hypothetical protein
MAQAITNPHLRAELACCNGQPKVLADYLKKEWPPDPEVLKSLSLHLRGSDNWTLRFIVRNGRPPAARSGTIWEAGQEATLSWTLYSLGESIANRTLPTSAVSEAQQLLRGLADVLDPAGPGKWKLTFRRPRVGNPSTPLKKTIRLAVLGHRALALYARLRNWQKVDEELDRGKSDAVDSKSRKIAVRLVKNPQKY